MLFPLIYSSDVRYLRNKIIHEYDIASGGYNVALSEKLIDDEDILEELSLASKKEKQIILGNYAKENTEFTKKLHEGFQKYIGAFITLNDIEEGNVIAIKKDSITFHSSTVKRTKFKTVKFTNRGTFSSYLKIGKLEFYYNGKTGATLAKGLPIDSYEETLVEEIFTLMKIAEIANSKKRVAKHLAELRHAYVTLDLTNNYYKELSALNGFKLKESLVNCTTYSDHIDDDNISNVDIMWNYRNIIIPLCEIFL